MAEIKNVQEKKLNSSIVHRLNARLFFRMLGIFLSVDLLICVLFTAGLISLENKNADQMVKSYGETSVYQKISEDKELLRSLGYEFSQKDDGAKYFSIDLSKPTIRQKIDSVKVHFKVGVTGGENLYVAKTIGPVLIHFSMFLFVIMIAEVFILAESFSKNKRTIRSILRPLEELTRAANALNSGRDLSPEYLKKIAGTLDSIDAARLDTRIPVSAAKTELKSLSMAINGMLDRIDEAYKSQMRFVSDASHELRTPIAVIQGYADLLDRWGKEDREATQEAIDAIKAESDSMKEMMEQLLFLARGDSQSMHVRFEAVDVRELAAEVFHEVQMIDRVHRLDGVFDEDTEAGGMVTSADRGLLKQLMRILIDNSLKYTKADGTVKIMVHRQGDQVCFSVQDEGIGISSESLPHIFDRFYRTDGSRARETGGTGLGLSIAKWIVERHRGQLEVVSRENIGSRFTVMLPEMTEDGDKEKEADEPVWFVGFQVGRTERNGESDASE